MSDSQAPSAGQEDQEDVSTDSMEKSIQKDKTALENEDRPTDSCQSSESSVNHPRLSLFSGMELINRGKPVCLVEPVLVETDTQTREEALDDINKGIEKSSERTAEPSSSSSGEQVSAFSFLNLWPGDFCHVAVVVDVNVNILGGTNHAMKKYWLEWSICENLSVHPLHEGTKMQLTSLTLDMDAYLGLNMISTPGQMIDYMVTQNKDTEGCPFRYA